MAEYIDIGQLWKCETCYHQRSNGCALGMFGCDHGESYRPAYNKLKKADVSPVVHGRLENIRNFGLENCYGYCNVCGAEHKSINPTALRLAYRHCRWCGARMDGDS